MSNQQSNGSNMMVQGRIVWASGNLFEGKKMTDMNTNQPLIGPDGQQKVEFGFGLAVPKIDPQTGQFTEMYTKLYQMMQAEALSIYPSGQLPGDFSFKMKDGDTDVDKTGKPYADREGYKGHVVIACTTRIPIKFFVFEGGQNILVTAGIKVGDYVNVQLNIKAHLPIGRGKAGLYLNPSAVQLVSVGQEIINTPSGDQIFGQNAPAYSGQVVAPTAPTMPQAQPGMPPAQPQMPQAPAAPQYAQPQAPQAPAAPHYPVLPNQMQPQAQPGMPPMQPQAQPQAQPGMPPMQPQMPGMPPMQQ